MGFEMDSICYNEIFKDNKLTFIQKSNSAFFNFKSKVIDLCSEDKTLKSRLERKDISFWYDPDEINSFFERNNLGEKYNDIKTSEAFNDYMVFCIFFVRLNKYASDKNLNINVNDINKKINKEQMLNSSFELLDFFIKEPSFKFVLKSDYMFDLLFSNKIPDESDIKKYVEALISYTKQK